MIESAIINLLSADQTVKALVGNRIAAAAMPQTQGRPNVVYQRISTTRTLSNAGPLNMATARIQLDVYADTYAQAKQVGEEIRKVLDGYHGGVIDLIRLDDESDMPGQPLAGTDKPIFRVRMDFEIHFHE